VRRRSARGVRELGLALVAGPALLASGALGRPAAAHALVLESRPAVDAVLPGPDLAIELRFNSRIDAQRSKLSLFTEDGQECASCRIELASGGGDGTLAGRASGLAPGRYRLRWQVLALDGHITRGDIPFLVRAP